MRELIAAERKFIHAQLRDGKITDEARRRIERDLDLEEASLANREFRKLDEWAKVPALVLGTEDAIAGNSNSAISAINRMRPMQISVSFAS